jgi:hypothetical protein
MSGTWMRWVALAFDFEPSCFGMHRAGSTRKRTDRNVLDILRGIIVINVHVSVTSAEEGGLVGRQGGKQFMRWLELGGSGCADTFLVCCTLSTWGFENVKYGFKVQKTNHVSEL